MRCSLTKWNSNKNTSKESKLEYEKRKLKRRTRENVWEPHRNAGYKQTVWAPDHCNNPTCQDQADQPCHYPVILCPALSRVLSFCVLPFRIVVCHCHNRLSCDGVFCPCVPWVFCLSVLMFKSSSRDVSYSSSLISPVILCHTQLHAYVLLSKVSMLWSSALFCSVCVVLHLDILSCSALSSIAVPFSSIPFLSCRLQCA